MNLKSLFAAIIVAVSLTPVSQAQSGVTEDFTQATTTNQWFFLYGACLTAGTSTSTASPGIVPACTSVFSTYYHLQQDSDAALVGGSNGFLGSTSAPATADAAGNGALRFTNGYPYGHQERGSIVYAGAPFPTNSGVQISFKTVTYGGDSGGPGKDGADGISFYLLDGCMPLTGGTPGTNSGVPSTPTCADNSNIYGYNLPGATIPVNTTTQSFAGVGATGGSLAYSCSNNNWPADGLTGAYLGLGIDEFGNFLNGTSNTLGEQNSTNTGADNTASGGLYQPGRIGLRGAGNISWQALTNAYGTYNGSGNPYYPAAMLTDTTCYAGTTYDPTLQACFSCSAGTYNTTSHACQVSSGNAPSPTKGATQAEWAVRLTCSTGNLYNFNPNNTAVSSSYNYSGATSGTNKYTSITPATLTTGTGTTQTANTLNPAGIMDYPAIGSTTSDGAATGYTVLTTPIANESAKTRGAATPILYNLKITQDGLLSLSYTSGTSSIATPVITNQSITSTNGPLPSTFRFGFAGSTGGDTNIHEILCFKAIPVETSNGSGGVSVDQNPTIKLGTQVFFAYYFPSDWTGQLTAQALGFNTTQGTPNFDQVVIDTVPTWDARCVLTGVSTTTGQCSTGVTSMAAQPPTSRVMITWDPDARTGIPFEWGSLSTAMQNLLDFGDSSANLVSPLNQQRLSYLRGDRTQEIATTISNGVSTTTGRFRARDSVLSDIIDSSPTWVGPPNLPYSTFTNWVDALYNTTGIETAYTGYVTAEQSRLNVVYAGANDGFLHGFRAGTEDVNGNTIQVNNDGLEVLAYMPGALLKSAALTTTCPSATTLTTAQSIHGVTQVDAACPVTTPAATEAVTANLDFSNTQYAHNYFVDATPATGDVYYPQNGTGTGTTGWHTWMVGGLGAGGQVIYALNITDPVNFTEANAAYGSGNMNGILVGEWSPSNMTCTNVTCNTNLGNTFGTPEIRRFHNGQWGAIIGNGIASQAGTAGIYIMLIGNGANGSTAGVPYFLYLATGSTVKNNGIVETASADLDNDHITDYIYAGDLQGNLWRFDVTSPSTANWGKPFRLFTTPGGAAQPITTRVTVGTLQTIATTTTAAGAVLSTGSERVMINFGTGQTTPGTVLNGATYATGQQYLFGVWDWNMGTAGVAGSGWNALNPTINALSLTASPPGTITPTNSTMVAQTITQEIPTVTTSTVTAGVTTTTTTTGIRKVSSNPICFIGDTTCSGGTNLGWYLALPDSAGTGSNEQVIFDPALSPDGEFTVNTFVPAVNTALSCTVNNPTGWSMGLNPVSGASSATPYFSVGGQAVDGVQLNGTGTPSFVYSGRAEDENAEYFITQASSNGSVVQPTKVNSTTIVTGQRLNWIQRR